MNKQGVVILVGMLMGSASALADINVKGVEVGDITLPVHKKIKKAPYKKKSITADDNAFHGYTRLHHVIDGKDNGFDRVTGSAVGFGLGYGRELLEGLKVGAELYGTMDTGLTDRSKSAIAFGLFLNRTRDGKDLGPRAAWGAHIRYQGDGFKAKLARSQFESPMTKTQITFVPNLYEYARVDTDLLGGNASLSLITRMSYGSRASADFGIIGERTGTGGMVISPFRNPRGYLERGRFYNISDTVQNNNSSGIAVAGYEKNIKKFNFRVWNLLVDDVANNLYADTSYKMSLGKRKGLKISAQVWNQNILNDFYEKDFGGTMFAAEAAGKWGPFIAKMAYSTKDEGGLLNAWGSNPGYTSSIFSRNQYRAGVNAYKATLVYKAMKNLMFMVSYADYGQSDMSFNARRNGVPFSLQPTTDATERDIVIVYKPREDMSIKLFNANRVSEFSGARDGKVDRTQNHTRLIMNFAF